MFLGSFGRLSDEGEGIDATLLGGLKHGVENDRWETAEILEQVPRIQPKCMMRIPGTV